MTSDRRAVNASPARGPAHVRQPWLAGLLALACLACGGKAPAAPPPTEEAARIACDGFAARAIQTGDTAEAARLSQRATECYTALRSAAPPPANGPAR